MEKRKQSKVAMNYGLMYGLAASAVYLIFYFGGASVDSKAPQWIGYLLLITFIIIGIKNYRDQDLGGSITYGKSLGTGVLIGLFGGIVTGLFTLLMFGVIDPTLGQQIVDAAQEKMIEQGRPEEQIDMAITWTKKFMHPIALFLFSIVGSVFMSFIFSLVISAVMKKDQNPFSSQA